MSNNDAQIADSPNYRQAWNDLRRMWANHPLVQALSNKPGDKTERRAASMAILITSTYHRKR